MEINFDEIFKPRSGKKARRRTTILPRRPSQVYRPDPADFTESGFTTGTMNLITAVHETNKRSAGKHKTGITPFRHLSGKKRKMCPITPQRSAKKKQVDKLFSNDITVAGRPKQSEKKLKVMPVRRSIAVTASAYMNDDWTQNPFSIPPGEHVNGNRRRTGKFVPVRPAKVETVKKSAAKSVIRPVRPPVSSLDPNQAEASVRKALVFDENAHAVTNKKRRFETPFMDDSPCKPVPKMLTEGPQEESEHSDIEVTQFVMPTQRNNRRSMRLSQNYELVRPPLSQLDGNQFNMGNKRRSTLFLPKSDLPQNTLFVPNLSALDDEVTGIRTIVFDEDKTVMPKHKERQSFQLSGRPELKIPVPALRISKLPKPLGQKSGTKQSGQKSDSKPKSDKQIDQDHETKARRSLILTTDRVLRSAKKVPSFARISEESESQNEIEPVVKKNSTKTKSKTPKSVGRSRRSIMVQDDGSPALQLPKRFSDDVEPESPASKKTSTESFVDGVLESQSPTMSKAGNVVANADRSGGKSTWENVSVTVNRCDELKNSGLKSGDLSEIGNRPTASAHKFGKKKNVITPVSLSGTSSVGADDTTVAGRAAVPLLILNFPPTAPNTDCESGILSPANPVSEIRSMFGQLNTLFCKMDWSLLQNNDYLALTKEIEKHRAVVDMAELRLANNVKYSDENTATYRNARADILKEAAESRLRTKQFLARTNTWSSTVSSSSSSSTINAPPTVASPGGATRASRKSVGYERLESLKSDHRFLKTPRRASRRSSILPSTGATPLRSNLKSQLEMLYDDE